MLGLSRILGLLSSLRFVLFMISLAFTTIIFVREKKLIILKLVNTIVKYFFNFNVMCFIMCNVQLCRICMVESNIISYVNVGYTLILSPFKN